MILAIAVEHDYEVLTVDAQTDFLNADDKKEIYVKMVLDHETYDLSGTPFVIKLRKSL